MRKKELEKKYQEILKQAIIEYRHYNSHRLFVAGLMSYLAVGDKIDQHTIRISSQQMDVHKVFIKFAKEYLGSSPEQVKFWLILHPDLDEDLCTRKWIKKLGLKTEQLYKNQLISARSAKSNRGMLHYGSGNTIIGSTVLKLKLNKWLELAAKEF